jgi:predicted metal-dependent hydrolase
MSIALGLPDTLHIGDLAFTVIASDKRATVGITVDRDGSLLLHAPAGCDPETLAMWAYTKRRWVYSKLAEKDLLLSARPAREFATGEGFAYLGRNHRLQLADVPKVKLERGRLVMPRDAVHADDAGGALIRWYRARGEAWLPVRLKPWAERTNLYPSALDVRDLGYRWGSLGRSNRLNIHWAVMQLPPSLIDYVLVHELSHLKYERHTPAFWALVERALPDYELRKEKLATTGVQIWLG